MSFSHQHQSWKITDHEGTSSVRSRELQEAQNAREEAKQLASRADIQDAWNGISQQIDQIMFNPTNVDSMRYMSLHHSIHQFWSKNWNRSPSIAAKLCYLYHRLDDSIKARVETIQQALQKATADDEALLALYADEWTRYQSGARMTSHTFSAVDNRHWRWHFSSDGSEALPLYKLHLKRFKDGLGLDEDNDVAGALRRMADRSAKSEVVDQQRQEVLLLVESFALLDLGVDGEVKAALR